MRFSSSDWPNIVVAYFYWTYKSSYVFILCGYISCSLHLCGRQNKFEVKAPNIPQEACDDVLRIRDSPPKIFATVEDAEMRYNFLETGDWRSVRGNISRYQNQKLGIITTKTINIYWKALQFDSCNEGQT